MIRLDNDLIEYFQKIVDRAGGRNYQTLINDALREYIRGASRDNRALGSSGGSWSSSRSLGKNGVKISLVIQRTNRSAAAGASRGSFACDHHLGNL
jgi:hypothetical protein